MNTPAKKRILVIEDEVAIQKGLADLFTFHGFEVTAESDGAAGLERGLGEKFDLVLLDVMLPKKNGFEVCQELRAQRPALPIVMLTAKTSEEDIVNGFSLGADDYVPKPFSVRELVVRVQAILRRVAAPPVSKILIGDHLTLDLKNLEGRWSTKSDRVSFTLKEVELLNHLLAQGETASTREELLVGVWGYRPGVEFDTRTVDIHIAKLRKKIEANPKLPLHLLTVRSVGYRLCGCRKAEG